MDPRPTATNPHATNPPQADLVERSTLRRYIETLAQTQAHQQLLGTIRLYVARAGIDGEHSVAEVALEIFQDVVVEALRSEARYDVSRNPAAWLLGIAANVVKRRREKLFGRRKAETTAADLAHAGEMSEEDIFERLAAAHGADPSQIVLASMGLDALLAQLSPADRRLIELDVLYELSASEVGDALGISAGNARVRRNRILTRLRKALLAKKLPEQKLPKQEAG